jgi:hypothetical protein
MDYGMKGDMTLLLLGTLTVIGLEIEVSENRPLDMCSY